MSVDDQLVERMRHAFQIAFIAGAGVRVASQAEDIGEVDLVQWSRATR
jgi:hypothetical protein